MWKKKESEGREVTNKFNEIFPFLCVFPKYFRLEDLRVRLEQQGYLNISYVVVNHQGLSSRLKYMHLKTKVSQHIPVYQQEENETDVWTLLNGNKDDFFIYDRCVFTHTYTHPKLKDACFAFNLIVI